MPKLELKFLGIFSVAHDGAPVTTFESNKVRALLTYLAAEAQRPHPREVLAGLLWPDWPDSAARSNLRYALADLRKAIGDQVSDPPFLLISRDSIQFNLTSDHRLDVVEFGEMGNHSSGMGASEEHLERLCQALALYKGEFLDGFSVPDAAPFEEWARLKREQLHRQHLVVLGELATAYERAGDVNQALTYAWRQVEIEPWQESGQRQLMRLLALNGQRSAALAQYEACRRILVEELHAEPSLETAVLYESIRDGRLDFQAGAPTILEDLPPAPGVPPFMGLQYFDERDADLYYGREALTALLVGQLRDLREARFLAVVGASGSGKSSLVRAGLVPAIRKGEKLADGSTPPRWSHRWLLHVITPTAHPLEALATSLTREGGSVSTTAALIDDLGRDPRSLHLYARRMTHLRNAPRLLLVVDQLEELFTLCHSESERQAFIENLLTAAGFEPELERSESELAGEKVVSSSDRGDGPVITVIALRADFYNHCAQYAGLRSALGNHQEFIGPMSPAELRRAIEEPARQNDWEFEPGLVDLILREVSDEPGALPLLSHALLETWERRRGRTLTLRGYAEAGGIHGAIAQTAESVYTDLSPDKRDLARRIFLRLTELGEGTQDTRRRASVSELVPSAEAATQIESVLNTLVEARLLTAGEGTVEVAHEALIREWPALRQWLDEDREGLRLHHHLTEAAQAWQAIGRDPGELYRGARLAQAAEWANQPENAAALNALEREFLEASRELEEREAAEREEQRQRELEAAQRAAEAERQRAEEQARSAARLRRRAQYLVGVVLIALVMTGVAAAFASRNSALAVQNAESARYANTQQAVARSNESIAAQNAATAVAAREEAEHLVDLRSRDAQVNQSLALAAQSRLAMQADNPDLAMALAMEANRIPNPPGLAQMALSEAAYAPGAMRVFLGHQAAVWSVAVSPDGRYGLSGDKNGIIYLWDLDTGEALRRLEGHTGEVTSLAFTPDGRHAVSASRDKTLIHWDLEKGEPIRQITGHQDEVNTMAISPDGRLAASGSGLLDSDKPSGDNSVRLWDLQNGEEIKRFEIFSGPIIDFNFTLDGQALAIGTKSDGFIVIDIHTDKVLARLGEAETINQMALSPVGFTAVINDFTDITSINLETGEAATLPRDFSCGVFGLDVSPDGRRVLTSSCNLIIEYDLETREEILRLNSGASSIAYLPDGHRALAGFEDGSLRLLALTNGAEIGRLPEGAEWLRGAAYDPDGRSVVTDDTVSLSRWDLTTGMEIWQAKEDSFWEIALSPDGRQVLAGTLNSQASLWDAATGELLKRLPSDSSFLGFTGEPWANTVAFHPSGKFALSGYQAIGPRTLIYWDLETGKTVWLFNTSKRNVLGVAISPDGRTALSAEWNGWVEWWDLETGKLIWSLKGHTNLIWSVAFIDNQTAISASDDGTMILWDLKSGTPLRSFLGHADGIKRVVLSPDKRLALSASRDGTAIFWDIQSGEALRHYQGHTDELMTVAWAPDGREALTGGRDNQAIRWRIDADLPAFLDWAATNRYVRPLTCAEREAFHIEPLCNGEAKVAAGEAGSPATPPDGTGQALLPPLATPPPLAATPAPAPAPAERVGMAVWGANLGSIPLGGGQVWEYAGQAGERLSIRLAAEHPANQTQDRDRQQENGLLDPTLGIYSPDGGLLAQSDDLENGVATDAYLSNLTLPVTGLYRIEVRSYRDQSSGSYRLVLAVPRPLVLKPDVPWTTGLAILPDGGTALVGGGNDPWSDFQPPGDHRIQVWDLGSGEVLRYLEGHTKTIIDIAISPDGMQALSADTDGLAILWDLESGKEIRRFDNQGVEFTDVQFRPDGQTVLTASSDGALSLWDLASGEVIQRFEGHEDGVSNIALSPDGETAYSTSFDNTLRVWNVATGEQLAAYQPFTDGFPIGLAVSPDGEKLLVGKGQNWPDFFPFIRHDTAIALLDAKTGETLRLLEGHTKDVGVFAFSPDGRYALSGSLDQTVRLWDVSTGEQLAVFIGHTGDIYQVAFSPDGMTGYSTSKDGSIRVWDLSEYIGGYG